MISIIIIVKNDASILFLLKKLLQIKKPEKTEIIVVDASEGNLDDIKNRFPKIRWIYFHNKTSKRITIPEQRNLGIKNAKGDIIAFIDAGCDPKNDWLIELIKPLRRDNEMFVTGLVTSKQNKQLHSRNWEKRKNAIYLNECGTANTAFKKEIFNLGIRFDETFDYGSDTEFSWRVVKKGYKIRYNPKAIVYLNWGGINEEKKRAFKYGQARVRLYKKHLDQIWKLFKYNEDLFTIYSLIFFFYVISVIPITLIYWYYPLFILIPIVKNLDKEIFKKLTFDFYWALGVLKELFFSSNKQSK